MKRRRGDGRGGRGSSVVMILGFGGGGMVEVFCYAVAIQLEVTAGRRAVDWMIPLLTIEYASDQASS